jgi:hypothetical protein
MHYIELLIYIYEYMNYSINRKAKEETLSVDIEIKFLKLYKTMIDIYSTHPKISC